MALYRYFATKDELVDALLDLATTLRGAGENLEAEALLPEAIGLAESAPMPGALLANALTYLSLHHLERLARGLLLRLLLVRSPRARKVTLLDKHRQLEALVVVRTLLVQKNVNRSRAKLLLGVLLQK